MYSFALLSGLGKIFAGKSGLGGSLQGQLDLELLAHQLFETCEKLRVF